jgi:hypothetical protein
VALTVALVGCGTAADIRSGDIRTYTLPRGQSAASSAAGASSAAISRPDGRDGGPPRLRYDVPEGWSDRGGGGMRLATLAIGDVTTGHEVTVIPASGTLEGNVVRWQGQLDPGQDPAAAAEAVGAAVAGAEVVEAGDLPATVVLLLDESARHSVGGLARHSVGGLARAAEADAAGAVGGEAILAAMLPLPGEPEGGGALFVKFKGPAAVARLEKDRFVRFVASLRLDPPGDAPHEGPGRRPEAGRPDAGPSDEE